MKREYEEREAEATAKLAEEETAAGAAAATEILREGNKPLEFVLPPLPSPANPCQWPTEIPVDRIGSGLNKKVSVYTGPITATSRIGL